MKLITLGGGCFWCIEACFQLIKGVKSIKSGYSGGALANPDYKAVCTGTTGHAEVVQLSYNEAELSTKKLLEGFMYMHDPTQLNRQGNDVGTQYRSAVFYHDEEQRTAAVELIQELNKTVYGGKIVTQIEKFDKFYPAEEYHDDYFNQNPQNPYCSNVVGKKVAHFKEYLKTL